MIKQENFSFTQLFIKFRVFGYAQSYGVEYLKHPFIFHEIHLNDVIDFSNVDDIHRIYLDIKKEEDLSFSVVELETSLLEDHNYQTKYLNECLKILIRLHNRQKTTEKLWSELEYFPLIQNSIKNLIIKISHNFASSLSPYNRDYYFSLIEIKKPLLSFRLRKPVQEEHFYQLIQQYMVQGGFISSSDIIYFKSLFEARRQEQKINWLEPKNTLCYFIKLLQRSQVIQKHPHSHWAVTAEFFLLKGRPISAKQLLNQPKPQNKIKVNTLENFVGLIL